MKSLLLLCLATCFTQSVYAQDFSGTQTATAQTCNEGVQTFDNTQLQTQKVDGSCYLSVHPRIISDLLYRDFLFDDRGLFMLFDSYGQGPESQTTAAREFLFFPRKTNLSYTYQAETKRVLVTSPSGKVFTFDAVKSVLLSVSGTTLNLTYDVVPERRGGMEVVTTDNLYLEGGYKRGQAPSQNPKNKIYFVDAAKNSCQVYNGDVYEYDSDQDSTFRFNDAELKSFLSSRCPKLKFSL